MITYPNIDPVIFSLGPLQVRWYGLMYVLGFSASWILVKYQLKKFKWHELEKNFDNLNLILILGAILGGRVGYVIFYNSSYYLDHPLEILATWNGGMSFHGGCLGVLCCGLLYCYRNNINFWKGADIYVVTAPVGLGLGRIGNFLNGELFGRVTDVPWAMVFPSGGGLPRHPSQLYEAFLEGPLLFIILWLLKEKPWSDNSSQYWPHGSMMSMFFILYGSFRFLVEFVREPDPQLGLLFSGLSMGQHLSAIMIAVGFLVWIWRKKSGTHNPA